MQLYRCCQASSTDLATLFAPARVWLRHLQSLATTHDDTAHLDGSHIDSIWSNAYVENERCTIVDREWIWDRSIPLNVIVIRAIHTFLSKLERHAPALPHGRSGRAVIRRIAAAIGVTLADEDFRRFVQLESQLQALVFGMSGPRHAVVLRWFLLDRSTLHAAMALRRRVRHLMLVIKARLQGVFESRRQAET